MIQWHYAVWGLHITSDMELPDWELFAESPAFITPDVRIVTTDGAVPPSVPPTPVFTARDCTFRVPDVAVYGVHDGRRIVVTPCPGAEARDIQLFLHGSALAALLYQRGWLGLHASVVGTAAGAVAFCGAAGAGKSTVAASLLARGYQFVADDLSRVDGLGAGAGEVVVYPSAPRLKLRRDVLVQMGQWDSRILSDERRSDKCHVAVTQPRPGTPVPLRAVCLLNWGDLGMVRLHGLTAVRGLVASASYRMNLLTQADQIAAHWQRCAALAGRVPVYVFSRPRDVSTLASGIDRVHAHLLTHVGDPS